jgi:hypothetical protein
MKLTELFTDNKVPWRWSFKGSEESFAEFKIGNIPYQVHIYAYNEEDEWEIEFSALQYDDETQDRTNLYGITKTGNSAAVLSVVLEIIKAFIELNIKKIHSLKFSAKEGSRKSLYLKMVQRLAPDWELEQDGESFSLVKP